MPWKGNVLTPLICGLCRVGSNKWPTKGFVPQLILTVDSHVISAIMESYHLRTLTPMANVPQYTAQWETLQRQLDAQNQCVICILEMMKDLVTCIADEN